MTAENVSPPGRATPKIYPRDVPDWMAWPVGMPDWIEISPGGERRQMSADLIHVPESCVSWARPGPDKFERQRILWEARLMRSLDYSPALGDKGERYNSPQTWYEVRQAAERRKRRENPETGQAERELLEQEARKAEANKEKWEKATRMLLARLRRAEAGAEEEGGGKSEEEFAEEFAEELRESSAAVKETKVYWKRP